MFSWAVMTALTALICLREQDERQGQPIKDCHLWSEREKLGGSGGLKMGLDEERDPSFFAKLKVTSLRWAMK